MKVALFNRKMIITTIMLLILIYFIYHTITGNRGLLMYFQLQSQIPAANTALSQIIQHREGIEQKIKLLRAETIDLDFLDELARRDLGLIHKNEKCFLLKYLNHDKPYR